MSHALDPKEEKLFLDLGEDREAIFTIQIKTRGLGAIDSPSRRAPTVKELHQAAELLLRRVYQFHSEE